MEGTRDRRQEGAGRRPFMLTAPKPEGLTEAKGAVRWASRRMGYFIARDNVTRYCKAAGLLGVELGSNVNGQYLGAPQFLPFFQEVERLGLAVFVHALHPTVAQHLSNASLVNPIGFPIDTCLTIVSLMAGGTAERCRTLRLAFSHGGGVLPLLLPRYHNQWSGTWNEEPQTEELRVTSRGRTSPFELARRFYFDTLVFDRRAIRYLIDALGHRQLLVGTDYPYLPVEQPADKTLRSLGLPRDISDDITWNNCHRFLGISTQEQTMVPTRNRILAT